jgi:hypothetical protein
MSNEPHGADRGRTSEALSDAEIRHILSLVRGDVRPWPRVVDDDVVARVHFQADPLHLQQPPEEVRLLEKAVSDLGFITSREEHVQLSIDAVTLLVVAIGLPVAANNLLKAANELPENLQKLRAKLRRHPRALLSAALQLEPVNRWLDATYGAKKWRYDPDAVTARVIADVVLFELTEEITGKTHRLLVRDDAVVDFTDLLPRGRDARQAPP